VERTRRGFDRGEHPSVFVRHRGIARSPKGRPRGRDFRAILKKEKRIILPRKCARTYEQSRARLHFAFYKPFEEARYEAQSRLCGGRRCDLKEHTPYIQRAVVMDEGHTRMMAVVRARGVPWYPT